MPRNILLLWDIDGTLIRCGGSGRNSLEETFKLIFNINDALDGINMSGKLDSGIIESALNKHDLALDNIEKIYKIYKDVLKRELEINDKFMIIPGIKNILDFTKEHESIYNVIATGNSKIGADLKLRRANLDYYFEVGSYGDNHTQRSDLVKNAVIQAENKYKIRYNKNDIYVIGDTPNDIIAGKENNYKTVAFATGGYTSEELEAYNPDYLFDEFSIKDLIDLFR